MATATKDAVLASAVDLARAAAEEVADRPELVGEHLGVVVEGERLVSHRFAATAQGYRGWHWAVTVARPPRARTATISEVDLLPGEDAILAPAWVPWAERLQPGDVGPGDVLPFLPDDDRLEQGFEATGDADTDEMAFFELGLGRERVLSRQGRSDAAQRWYAGTRGPTAPQAVAASAPCSTCAFLLLMAGSLRTEFGVCANEWSPDDGRVVSMDHGCGAHSQTDVAPAPSDWPDPAPVLDEMGYDAMPADDEATTDEATTDEATGEGGTDTGGATDATPGPGTEQPATTGQGATTATSDKAKTSGKAKKSGKAKAGKAKSGKATKADRATTAEDTAAEATQGDITEAAQDPTDGAPTDGSAEATTSAKAKRPAKARTSGAKKSGAAKKPGKATKADTATTSRSATSGTPTSDDATTVGEVGADPTPADPTDPGSAPGEE